MNESASNFPEISERASVTDAVRVQILAAEHWDLLATRSMTWNQIFSRASMFITLTSAVVVSLALVAQATHFDMRFRLFALLLLPAVLILGFATFIHLGESNGEDTNLVISLNRLRRAYVELAPDLKPYFPPVPADPLTGFPGSFGSRGYTLIHFLGSTPSIIAAINVIVIGVIAALIADAIGLSIAVDVGIGIILAIVAAIGHAILVRQRIASFRREFGQDQI